MKATYIYKKQLGILPFIMKAVTAVMLTIVLARATDSTMNKIIVLLCAAYFSFSLVKLIISIKNRPLFLKIDNKGIEYSTAKNTVSSLWADITGVNEYYVPLQRSAGYFRIDLKLRNGGIIWFTNNILLSEPPKRESANYLEIKNFISRKVSKDRIKFQMKEN